jgi:hypothetical protein
MNEWEDGIICDGKKFVIKRNFYFLLMRASVTFVVSVRGLNESTYKILDLNFAGLLSNPVCNMLNDSSLSVLIIDENTYSTSKNEKWSLCGRKK